jgi:hypothetical protein
MKPRPVKRQPFVTKECNGQCPFCGMMSGSPDAEFLVCDVSEMPWPWRQNPDAQITVRRTLGFSRAYSVHCENCGAWGPVQTSQQRAIRDFSR